MILRPSAAKQKRKRGARVEVANEVSQRSKTPSQHAGMEA